MVVDEVGGDDEVVVDQEEVGGGEEEETSARGSRAKSRVGSFCTGFATACVILSSDDDDDDENAGKVRHLNIWKDLILYYIYSFI